MKRGRWLVVGGAITLGAALAVACGFDPPAKHTSTSAVASTCTAEAGVYPEPNCDKSERICESSGCQIDPQCNSDKTCMPFADNASNPTLDFRIRWLNVVSPSSLAQDFIQKSIINHAIKLKQCSESGTGAFNWLLRVNRTTSSLETGGAPPTVDPFGLGYCFFQGSTGVFDVRPEHVPVTFTGDTFSTETIPRLLVPIFNEGNFENVIYLPLTDVRFLNVGISPDSNCIGAYNPAAVDNNCNDDIGLCSRWTTNGSLGGYISLEESDSVAISLVNRTLCAILTGDSDNSPDAGPLKHCVRENGAIRAKGDYCSKTKTAGDCQDSMWLSATFAASAVKIHDGATTVGCGVVAPAPSVDAGSDASADAGADADAASL